MIVILIDITAIFVDRCFAFLQNFQLFGRRSRSGRQSIPLNWSSTIWVITSSLHHFLKIDESLVINFKDFFFLGESFFDLLAKRRWIFLPIIICLPKPFYKFSIFFTSFCFFVVCSTHFFFFLFKISQFKITQQWFSTFKSICNDWIKLLCFFWGGASSSCSSASELLLLFFDLFEVGSKSDSGSSLLLRSELLIQSGVTTFTSVFSSTKSVLRAVSLITWVTWKIECYQ